MEKIIKDRKDVDINLTWDLSSIFKTDEEFEAALKELSGLTSKIEVEYKGKLTTADAMNYCLDLYREVLRLMTLTGTYVQLAVSVDYSDNENQARYFKTINQITDADSRLSFIKSELIEASQDELEKAIASSKENRHFLWDIKREKPYAMHPEVERVLSSLSSTELTWMRQPHYYMGLYSYTYSAGLTIATQVSKRILNEGQPAIDDWKEVLKAGSTKTPEELAKMAGVDISTDQPLLDTIEYIGSMIDEIIKLTDEIE